MSFLHFFSGSTRSKGKKNGTDTDLKSRSTDRIILGGTHQIGDWYTEVRDEDKEYILRETAKMIPSLKHAEFISDAVGLRPGRSPIRLEKEDRIVKLEDAKQTKTFKVVHNYGHGGAGITLCWGTAQDAAELVMECLAELSSNES